MIALVRSRVINLADDWCLCGIVGRLHFREGVIVLIGGVVVIVRREVNTHRSTTSYSRVPTFKTWVVKEGRGCGGEERLGGSS